MLPLPCLTHRGFVLGRGKYSRWIEKQLLSEKSCVWFVCQSKSSAVFVFLLIRIGTCWQRSMGGGGGNALSADFCFQNPILSETCLLILLYLRTFVPSRVQILMKIQDFLFNTRAVGWIWWGFHLVQRALSGVWRIQVWTCVRRRRRRRSSRVVKEQSVPTVNQTFFEDNQLVHLNTISSSCIITSWRAPHPSHNN